jgi:hypothetical protein
VTAVIGVDLPDCVWELAVIGDNRLYKWFKYN